MRFANSELSWVWVSNQVRTSRLKKTGNVATRATRWLAVPCEVRCRSSEVAICGTFIATVSKPSPLNEMSSPYQRACSEASAWQ